MLRSEFAAPCDDPIGSVSAKGAPMLKNVLIGLLLLGLAAALVVVLRIGPKNIVGMIRYDQRQEGNLRIGDHAPDVELLSLDGKTPVRLTQHLGGRPCIVVFGSFT